MRKSVERFEKQGPYQHPCLQVEAVKAEAEFDMMLEPLPYEGLHCQRLQAGATHVLTR